MQRAPIDACMLTVPSQVETSRTCDKPRSHDLIDSSKITNMYRERERYFAWPSISGITHRVCVVLLTSGAGSGNVLGLELGLALGALEAKNGRCPRTRVDAAIPELLSRLSLLSVWFIFESINASS